MTTEEEAEQDYMDTVNLIITLVTRLPSRDSVAVLCSALGRYATATCYRDTQKEEVVANLCKAITISVNHNWDEMAIVRDHMKHSSERDN